MIRPSSRRAAWSWVSKWWQAAGVGSAARKLTTSCATWEMTERSRRVSGASGPAKGVARSVAMTVAWSIGAIPVVKRAGFVTSNSPRDRLAFKIRSYRSSPLRAFDGRRSRNFCRKPRNGRDRTLHDQVAEDRVGGTELVELVED